MGRRLGQHFLTDTAILDRIVDGIDPTPEDIVVEIGPGKGALTERLARHVRSVIAIERDTELARDLGLRIADCGLRWALTATRHFAPFTRFFRFQAGFRGLV